MLSKNYSANACGPQQQSLGNAKVKQEPYYSDPTYEFNHCQLLCCYVLIIVSFTQTVNRFIVFDHTVQRVNDLFVL